MFAGSLHRLVMALVLVLGVLSVPLAGTGISAQSDQPGVADITIGASACPTDAAGNEIGSGEDCGPLPVDGVTVTVTDANGLTAAQCALEEDATYGLSTCDLGVANGEEFNLTLDESALPEGYTVLNNNAAFTSPREGDGGGAGPTFLFAVRYVAEEEVVPSEDSATEESVSEEPVPGSTDGSTGSAAPGSAGTGSPAAIYAGDCDTDFAEAEAVAVLSEVTTPEGERRGAETASAAETSFTTLDLPLDDILAEDHVLVVFDEDDDTVALACGAIGGVVTDGGELIFGLGAVGESRFSGVAYLTEDGDQTLATVFLAEDLSADEDQSA